MKGLANIIASEENALAIYTQETKDIEIDRVTKEQDAAYKTKAHVLHDHQWRLLSISYITCSNN